MKVHIFIACFVMSCLYEIVRGCTPTKAPGIVRFQVFGDSLTDNGVDDFDPRQDIHGFGRLSNGPIWADYVAKDIGITDENYKNYGYAGAKSDLTNGNGFTWSGVMWQVDRYLADTPNVPETTLVGFQTAGFNDFFAGVASDTVISNFNTAIRKLAAAGSKKIVVSNLSDSTRNPAYVGIPPAGMGLFLTTVNQGISDMIADVRKDFPDLKLALVDLYQLTNDVLDSGRLRAQAYDSTGGAGLRSYGEWYQDAFFQDGIHPSTSSHKIAADEVVKIMKQMDFL